MPKPRVCLSRFYRASIYYVQDGRCHYCGERMTFPGEPEDPRSFTIDEMTPQSLGGKRVIDNQVGACRECNNRKGSTPYHAYISSRHRMPEIKPVKSMPKPSRRLPKPAFDLGRVYSAPVEHVFADILRRAREEARK